VRVLPSEELSALVPERRAAILEITAKDGNRYQERVDFPKGEPENPMSAEEIRKKFLDLAGNAKNPKPDPEKDTLVQVVFNMESQLPELFPLYR
jgi:2-methylcitrate dehydratase PrpD